MRLICVSGYKDSGKSTLCRALLSRLTARGFRTGYIKRTQEYVASQPATDTGAAEALGVDALLWGDRSFRWEGICEQAAHADPAVVAGRFFPDADVVVLEGGKELRLPKIWVLRQGEPRPAFPGIFALYDRYGPGDGGERYGADEVDRLCEAIAARVRPGGKSARVYVDDVELPMKDFICDFVAGGIRGMLGALKLDRVEDVSGDVRVYLRSERKEIG